MHPQQQITFETEFSSRHYYHRSIAKFTLLVSYRSAPYYKLILFETFEVAIIRDTVIANTREQDKRIFM